MEKLINTDVRFTVSEPESFYFDNGEGPFEGVIVGYGPGILFLKIRSELKYLNKQLVYLAVVVRYEGESLTGINANTHLVVNLVPLLVDDKENNVFTEELVNLAKGFRGQHLIGDVWLAERRSDLRWDE